MLNFSELDKLAITTTLAPIDKRDQLVQDLTRLSIQAGVYPASISKYYRALASNEIPPMTIPAVNIRGMTYDIARVIWRLIQKLNTGPVIFELAPSESEISDQSFEEYAALILAAAVREGWHGPVFLQGDHITVDSIEAVSDVKKLCKRLIDAGYYQIDIDASHIPVSNDINPDLFHADNAIATATITEYVRNIELQNHPITLGAEVGEIGKRNTSPKDVKTFMSTYLSQLSKDVKPFDKISVQTGTKHGGYVLVDGTTGEMPLDLLLINQLSNFVRENYDITGLVQHGASTLSFKNLSELADRGVVEVHLATGIQNIVFDHPAFPDDLRVDMIASLVTPIKTAEGDELKENNGDLSDAQRFYNARWAAWGPYKQKLCTLPESVKKEIESSLEVWFEKLFYALKITDQMHLLKRLYPEKE